MIGVNDLISAVTVEIPGTHILHICIGLRAPEQVQLSIPAEIDKGFSPLGKYNHIAPAVSRDVGDQQPHHRRPKIAPFYDLAPGALNMLIDIEIEIVCSDDNFRAEIPSEVSSGDGSHIAGKSGDCPDEHALIIDSQFVSQTGNDLISAVVQDACHRDHTVVQVRQLLKQIICLGSQAAAGNDQ